MHNELFGRWREFQNRDSHFFVKKKRENKQTNNKIIFDKMTEEQMRCGCTQVKSRMNFPESQLDNETFLK